MQKKTEIKYEFLASNLAEMFISENSNSAKITRPADVTASCPWCVTIFLLRDML